MFNPPNLPHNSGSYVDLLKRMTQRVREQKVDTQILEILQQVYEKELDQENIVLSRPERVRLFQQVAKVVLTDVLGKIDGAK
jgi:hypothetical protein